MIKRFFIPLSLLVLLLISYGIYLLLNSNQDKNHTTDPSKISPNVFMQESTYNTYSAEGILTSTIRSTLTTYNKQQDQATFSHPIVTSYADNQPTWHITALHGNSSKNNTTIKLWGDVKFHRLASDESPATVITTTEAMIYPKQSLAKTEKPVTIKQLKSVAHGTGMTADLKNGNYTLLSHSKGEYIPPEQPAK